MPVVNYPRFDFGRGGAAPASSLPSWLSAAAVNEWVAVPTSTIQGSAAWQAMPSDGHFWGNQAAYVNGENGCGLDEDTSTLWLFGGVYVGNGSAFRVPIQGPVRLARR